MSASLCPSCKRRLCVCSQGTAPSFVADPEFSEQFGGVDARIDLIYRGAREEYESQVYCDVDDGDDLEEPKIVEADSNQEEDDDMDDDNLAPTNPYRRYLLLCRRGYGGLTDAEAAEVDAYDAKMGTQGDWRTALNLTKIAIDDLLQQTPKHAREPEKRKAPIVRQNGLLVPRRYAD